MAAEKGLKNVYLVAVILFVVGVFCYAAFPAKAPEEPLRVVYSGTNAKQVLFHHDRHMENYGAACGDCHHHPSGDDGVIVACGECHLQAANPDGTPPQLCLDCHADDDAEITDTEMLTKTDAFHGQCGACHESIDQGPASGDCAGCHAL
ncbi:MAG: cytochrome c3 family protein [Desulfobacterales bacterium]